MENQVLAKIDKILEKANLPDRHTYFQIEKFMIGKEPTVQSQLWAIVRELQARKETIEVHHKELQDAEDNLELFDIKIQKLDRKIKQLSNKEGVNNDLNIQEAEIHIRKIQREKESLIKSAQKANKRLKCVIEEADYLLKGFNKIVEQFGEMKPLDDEQSQKELWNEKLLEEFNLRIILQKPLDPEFVRTVLCLNDDATVKKQVITLIENIQNRMLMEKKHVLNVKPVVKK